MTLFNVLLSGSIEINIKKPPFKYRDKHKEAAIYCHGLLKTNTTQQKNATPFKTP